MRSDQIDAADLDRGPRQRGAVAPELEDLRLPHFDRSDLEPDEPVVAEVRDDVAPGYAQLEIERTGAVRQPGGRDACAVARELRRRTVGVPDPQLRAGTVGGE